MFRRVGLLLGLAIVVASAPTASRADDANRACDNDQDVTIVVDFGALGGGVNVRCASQPINNGFDVFRHANVSYETVSGSDFVCRIAGKPGVEAEDCANTPPADAYWTYWYAKRGGAWKYSNLGPASRKPPAGSYEGWSFNSGDDAAAPRYPVPAAPSPTTTAAPAPDQTAPTSPSPAPPTSRTASAVATTTTAPAASVDATTSTSVAALALTPETTTSSVPLGDVDLSVGSTDGGSSVGFILSAVGLGGLAVLAYAFVRRRGQ